MPNNSNHLLPGVRGKDYHFVRYGGQMYVVYDVNQPGMPNFRISMRIDQSDYKAYGIDPSKFGTVNKATFQNFQHLGNASEIVLNSKDHPFDQYLHHLQELNGHVSWLNNREFLSTMLEGFLKGWDATETQQALTQTQWYQHRTQTQRDWALNLSKADRGAAVNGISAQMEEELRNLYGPDFALKDTGLTKKKMAELAQNIASGKFGTADEGFQLWQQRMRNRAEKVEGTPAWIAKEQQQEQTNQFNNRPEDMFQQIQQQAFQWLGPQGQLDQSTLKRWANNLVTGKNSEADWQQFIQRQAQSLYPFLDANESWQDRASSYKNIAEQNLGRPIAWNDPLLSKLGAVDANGQPTGEAASFGDFTKSVRSDGRFWTSPNASQETYQVFDELNRRFNGQGVA